MTRGAADEPLVATLPGGLACRVLSPGRPQLAKLRPKWLPAVQEADLDPAAPVAEEALRPPGRLERMGAPDLRRAGGGAHAGGHQGGQRQQHRDPRDLGRAYGAADRRRPRRRAAGDVGPLARSDGTLEVDLFKLPHHGSKANVTDALMKRVRAKCYVFSSSGQGRSQHPNDPAVARVIINSTGDRVLAFNYRNKRTEMWQDAALRRSGAIGPCTPMRKVRAS